MRLNNCILERVQKPVKEVVLVQKLFRVEIRNKAKPSILSITGAGKGSRNNLRVDHPILKVGPFSVGDHPFEKLLDRCCPIPHPLALSSNGQSAISAFPLESPDLVCTHTLCKPDNPSSGHPFAQALIKKNFASDAMGYGTT